MHSSEMTPQELYQVQLSEHILSPNPIQQEVMGIFDVIYHDLVKRQKVRNSTPGKLRRKIKPRAPIQGLYLWGGVGIGKTHMMDLFYECVPVKKMRVHFHQFMHFIHRELANRQGQKNPLQAIGRELADNHLVICFDEFFVSNIADAMLLGELLDALFKGGICLIASSNVEPKQLYKDGIQRENFLPAIALLEKNTRVMHVTADQDYRLRHVQEAGVYYSPLDNTAQDEMEHCFRLFSQGEAASFDPIELLGRDINIIKQADATIWFEFLDLCNIPRSQNDYLELVKRYKTILVSNVAVIKSSQDSLVTSFINFIDVMYDAHIRVVISAETPIEKLYTEGRMTFEFERTKSRIIEMQSREYFS